MTAGRARLRAVAPVSNRCLAPALGLVLALSPTLARADENPAPPPVKVTVVVYCAVDRDFAEPLLRDFATQSGLDIRPVFDTEAGKTTGLANKLLAERDNPRADVWWSGELFVTIDLARKGVFAPYRPPTAADIPEEYRDPEGYWTAYGLRARVIAYDPKRTRPEDLPRSWAALTDAKYKGKVALADPRFGTTRGHMAVLCSLWGEAELTRFLQEIRENDYRRANGNAHALLLLKQGLVDFAATDTDDVIVARRRGDSIDMIYPRLDHPISHRPGEPGETGTTIHGTLWIPSSVALVKGSRNPAAARALVDHLASRDIERALALSDSQNVPVRGDLRREVAQKNPEWLLGKLAEVVKANPGEPPVPHVANVDYRAAGLRLEKSDKLVTDVLLR